MHYYIVGTRHELQRRSLSFKEKLRAIVNSFSVVLIAEEMDVNLSDGSQKSMGRDLANEQTPRIPWLPLGMTKTQEISAGIYDALESAFALIKRGITAYPMYANSVKENYWLDCIEKECRKRRVSDGTVLITCGRIHLDFLGEKAAKRRISSIDKIEYPDGLGQQIGSPEMMD